MAGALGVERTLLHGDQQLLWAKVPVRIPLGSTNPGILSLQQKPAQSPTASPTTRQASKDEPRALQTRQSLLARPPQVCMASSSSAVRRRSCLSLSSTAAQSQYLHGRMPALLGSVRCSVLNAVCAGHAEHWNLAQGRMDRAKLAGSSPGMILLLSLGTAVVLWPVCITSQHSCPRWSDGQLSFRPCACFQQAPDL